MMISDTFDGFLVDFLHIKDYHLIGLFAIPTLRALIPWSIRVESIIPLIISLSLHYNYIVGEINQCLGR